MIIKISETKARALRNYRESGKTLNEVLIDKKESLSKSVKVSSEIYTRYFSDTDKKEIRAVIEKALTMYFEQQRCD